MKKTIKTKVIATAIATVCAVSTLSAVSVASASATSVPTTLISAQANGKSYQMTFSGDNWNYYAESLNAKITCNCDVMHNKCTFKATGVTPGITNAVLKVRRNDGRWNNFPVQFVVDNNLNVTGKITGNSYITDSDRTTSSQTSNQSSSSSSTKGSSSTVIAKNVGSTFKLPMKGSDWNYYASSLNVKITCDFNYNSNICNFIFTAVKPGVTEAVLKTERNDGKWDNTPVKITVDNNLKMTIEQTGDAYITNFSYTK